jgi:predicted dehydrogenase
VENTRIGIIGIGNMGSSHALQLSKLAIPGGSLEAVCDIKPERLNWAKDNLGKDIKLFDNTQGQDDHSAVLL